MTFSSVIHISIIKYSQYYKFNYARPMNYIPTDRKFYEDKCTNYSQSALFYIKILFTVATTFDDQYLEAA